MKHISIFRTTLGVIALVGGIVMHSRSEAADDNVVLASSITAKKPDGSVAPTPLALRNLITKGETIEVFYDPCVVTGEIKFKETARRTRLQHDLALIAAKFDQNGNKLVDCNWTSKKYTLKETRATLLVTATKAGGEEITTVTVLTGPAEHFSLGLDLPVSDRKILKYDEGSKKLVPKDDAPQLYLSLNMTPGDVLVPLEEADLKDRIELKLMVAASSHPLDSYGVGIGYKLRNIESINLTGLSVFAGYFATKQDKLAECACSAAPSEGRKHGWRFGLSYDVATAIGWLTR